MTLAVAEVRKALVAICGGVGQMLSLGLIPHPYDQYVTAGLAVATALGVYAIPNVRPTPTPPANA